MARITLRNDKLGWPGVNDPYIGVIRLDEKKCSKDILRAIAEGTDLQFDVGDSTLNHWVESITNIVDNPDWMDRNALYIQFRRGARQDGELTQRERYDKLYIALNINAHQG